MSVIDSSVIVLQSSQDVLGLDPTLIISILVTILIAVFTAMGAVIKVAYDTANKWDAVLSGSAPDDDIGFIDRSKERHTSLQNQHEEVYEQMLIQGQLLSELTYAFADIAEELEKDEDTDVNVNLDKIERLRQRKEEKRDDAD